MNDLFLNPLRPSVFLAPRIVLQGDGATGEIGAQLAQLVGSGTLFIVSDEAVMKLGLADALLASVASRGFSVAFAAHVHSEPSIEVAEAAIAAANRAKPVAVLGIGGGSAIDLAKVVALAAFKDAKLETYFGATGDAERLPLVAVPTTAGTGAEVTRIAMLLSDNRKIIINTPAIIPDLVVVDPQLTVSLPRAITASTGLDALAHAVESLLSTSRSPSSSGFARQALGMIAGAIEQACAEPAALGARRSLMYGAHFAGLGLNGGVVLGHSIGYTLATRAPIPHGVSCAIALPYCVRYALSAARDVVEEIAEIAIGHRDAERFIDWLYDLNRALSIPIGLPGSGVESAQPAELAAECMSFYPRPNNPSPYDLGRLTALYEAMKAGDSTTTAF